MKRIHTAFAILVVIGHFELAQAVEFESMKSALGALLGTPKVTKKSVEIGGDPAVAFYAKGADGKATHLAFIEKGIYAPNCTHTWAVGVDPKSGSVTSIRVIEMSCPHAFPTKTPSFLDWYKGKGPAQAATLKNGAHTIAKATGSADLTTKAVLRSITAFGKLKGQI